MEMGADEPQITGYKLRDGKMEPTMAPGREYMAELERRDAEMRDQYEGIDYQPAQEDVSKYGIKQTWETRFGQGPPTMTTHRISSPAGKGKVEYRIGDQYKVAVYPGAEIADQSTMEGISLQMQYNTSAWQRDPNHRVERVSPEQLMDQTRRKLNQPPNGKDRYKDSKWLIQTNYFTNSKTPSLSHFKTTCMQRCPSKSDSVLGKAVYAQSMKRGRLFTLTNVVVVMSSSTQVVCLNNAIPATKLRKHCGVKRDRAKENRAA